MEVPGREEHTLRMARKQPAVKKRRACEPCRSLKARCLFGDSNMNQCSNCIKFKRRCVIGDDLRYPRPSESSGSSGIVPGNMGFSMLGNSQTSVEMSQDDSVPSESEAAGAFAGLFPFLFSNISIANDGSTESNRAPPPLDAIDRGILDLETASDAFKYYLNEFAPRLPLVAFPPDVSVAECRSTTPILFLAVLIAGTGRYQSNIQAKLLDEFCKIIADQVVCQGQKRLELVQAILVTWMWMPPPDRLEDMKFSLMAYLSASMIQDLRLKSARHHPNGDESTILEGRRTLLGCYCACAMLSLVLRRPTILPFNDFMSQSLEIVKESPEALPTDKTLVAWVELQRISIDLAEAKNTTTNSTALPGIGNMKNWLARTFETRVFNWKETTDDDVQNQVILMLEYHTIMLHANLLGISDGRTPIAPPFTVDMISPKSIITDLPAFGKSIASAQAVLDCFLRLSPNDIPAMPGVMFPRMLHALLVLIVAASALLGAPNNQSNRHYPLCVKDVADLAIPAYFDRLAETFRKSPGPLKGRATKATLILTLLKKWCMMNILHVTEGLSASKSPGSSTTHQGTTSLQIADPGVSMDMDNFPAPNDSQSTRPIIVNQSADFHPPNPSNFDAMLQSGQPIPLREEQYAFFESLVESPEGPPWTLFEDAMAVFDFI